MNSENNFYDFLKERAFFSDQLISETVATDSDCWEYVMSLGCCTQTELIRHYANYKSWPIYTLSELTVDESFASYLEKYQLKTNEIIPLYQTDQCLCVATSNPCSHNIELLKQKINKEISIKLVLPNDIISSNKTVDQVTESSLLDKVLGLAYQKEASDIHVLNKPSQTLVWVRVDGQLQDLITLSVLDGEHLKKLIKLNANLDISEHSNPQDGQLTHFFGDKKVEVRVSTIPTFYNEDLVLRLFNASENLKTIYQLGFPNNIVHKLKAICNMNSGLFLVAGPTGSGKTSTLYACLQECSANKKRIIVTLEDPIERHISNVRQSQVNAKTNYSFQRGLRAIMRQDPDVIMIGEIRDSETARIALEAAYTGHLVFSSLHTSSIESSWRRLLHFGCDPFLLSYCVRGILTQSLLPEKCTVCLGKGCNQCSFRGIKGRYPKADLLSVESYANVYTLENVSEIIEDHLVLSTYGEMSRF